MKLALLTRLKTGPHGTFGKLTVDGQSYQTGELPERGNQPSLSCIPAGEYRVDWHHSPRFGDCYQLEAVPGRSHILIHAGNLCGDTTRGLKSDVEGCVLLGYSVGALNGQDAVLSSKAAVADFEEYMKRAPFTLRVVDEYLEAGAPAHVMHVPV